MQVDSRFPKQVGATFVAGLVLAAISLNTFGSQEMLLAAVVGAVLSTLNIVAGFLVIEYAFDKSYNTILAAVLGGMGIRIAAMLCILFVLIKLVELHPVALVVSSLSFYIVYLFLEVLYIQKKVSHKS